MGLGLRLGCSDITDMVWETIREGGGLESVVRLEFRLRLGNALWWG